MEYRDSKLLNFLSVNGTLYEFSSPGTFQQNGRAEIKHRHIFDFAPAMIISSSYSKQFWCGNSYRSVYYQ